MNSITNHTYLRYVYSSSNQTVDWFNWEARKNQPDNYAGKEDCVFYYHLHYSDGFWDDEDCEHQNHFICQKELNIHFSDDDRIVTCNLKFPYDTLTFKHNPFQNQTDLVSLIEIGARILLQEMEIWLDVDGRPNRPHEDSKLNDRRLVHNTFQKLSLMENLSNETLDLVNAVGTLLIKKLAEHPGPVTKPTESRIEKFIYFILQMLSRNPHFPENVMTNLQKIGMWLTY